MDLIFSFSLTSNPSMTDLVILIFNSVDRSIPDVDRTVADRRSGINQFRSVDYGAGAGGVRT